MSDFVFAPADRVGQKVRAAVYGISGSGKTRFAIQTALALGERVAVVDTEHGRASEFADILKFDVLRLDSFEVANYQAAIAAAVKAEYDALVIDSLSHAWEGKRGLLEIADRATDKQKAHGGIWGTTINPQLRSLIDWIVKVSGPDSRHPMHVICTLRAKTVYEKDASGKRVPVGEDPVFKKGIEYDFSFVANIEHGHRINFIKAPPGSGLEKFSGDSLDFTIAEAMVAWTTP